MMFPALQGSDAFVITPSDTVDIKDDVGNVENSPFCFVHNPSTGGTVRVMPAGQRGARGFTLTGTSGTANVTVNGVNYLATFSSTLSTTATNFVTTHGATLKALGIEVTAVGAQLRFKNAHSLAIANVSGDLSGTALAPTAVTVFIAQGATLPLAVRRVYASTPTPPSGLIGIFSGQRSQ